MALNENREAFIVYVNFLILGLRMTIHLAKKTQITLLLAKEVIVPVKYLDFADIFLEESANILPEQTQGNKHTIKL